MAVSVVFAAVVFVAVVLDAAPVAFVAPAVAFAAAPVVFLAPAVAFAAASVVFAVAAVAFVAVAVVFVGAALVFGAVVFAAHAEGLDVVLVGLASAVDVDSSFDVDMDLVVMELAAPGLRSAPGLSMVFILTSSRSYSVSRIWTATVNAVTQVSEAQRHKRMSMKAQE